MAWGARNRGRLSVSDRFVLAGQAIALRLETRGQRHSSKPPVSSAALREVAVPSSELARRAEALCHTHSDPWLVQHCMRTYYWGALLALRDGLRYDAELFYVASLLHDLGLTPAAAPAPGECFAITGADAAYDQLRALGCPDERAKLAAEAIAMHLNVRVGLDRGVEAHLLRAGSGLDVAGMRGRQLSAELRADVVARHPRHQLKREMSAVVEQQTARSPRTRIAFLCKRADFVSRIRRTSFAE
jgi:HD superfamily phosphodiesterase